MVALYGLTEVRPYRFVPVPAGARSRSFPFGKLMVRMTKQ
jgi:hypothetical protein